MNPEVTVVMPCLNEAETLATCIEKIIKTFQFHNIMGEIIVADNGSTDGSQKIAMDSGARVVPVARRGYGAALQGGIAAASAPYIIMGDADDSYNFREMPRFIEALRNGHDFVMGCRFPAGGGEIKPGAMPFLHRYLGTPVLTALGQIFFHHRFKDVNCGMRGFTKRAFEEMALQSDGMEFASEMVARAAMINLKSCEVPVTLHPDGRSRAPHLRTWRDGWRHLKFMLLLCPRWLYRMPGLFLSLLGGDHDVDTRHHTPLGSGHHLGHSHPDGLSNDFIFRASDFTFWASCLLLCGTKPFDPSFSSKTMG